SIPNVSYPIRPISLWDYTISRWLVIILTCQVFTLTLGKTVSADAPQQPVTIPTFGQPILSLKIPNMDSIVESFAAPDIIIDGTTFDVMLSANGNYVVGSYASPDATSAGDCNRNGRAKLEVWTLPAYDQIIGSLATLLPTISRDIDCGGAIAPSPNEQFVAVSLQDGVAIYTLPQLNFVAVIAAAPSLDRMVQTTLVWSPDSRFVASIRQHQLLAWDAQTQRTYTYEFAFDQTGWRNGYGPNLKATTGGWLLDLFSQPKITFLACDWQLSNCLNYGDDSSNYIVNNSDPSLLLSATDFNKLPISTHIWRLQNDGTYVRDEIALDIPPDFIPVSLSPSGEYIFFRSDTLSQIWRTSDWTIVQTLSPYDHPVWFPDEDYFLTYTNFTTVDLYQTGQTTPYTSQDFLEEITSAQRNRIDLTVASWTINAHGTYALFRGGWTNLVIPFQ
ncbi:MAG: hypothetical protein ABI835_06885, partial [Chloroflexota bacterium]